MIFLLLLKKWRKKVDNIKEKTNNKWIKRKKYTNKVYKKRYSVSESSYNNAAYLTMNKKNSSDTNC